MIGNLICYKRAGNTALGIVVDMFRYEGNRRSPGPINNCLVVSVEWVADPPVPPPPQLRPEHALGDIFEGDERYWPQDWQKRKWYRADIFKVISDGE